MLKPTIASKLGLLLYDGECGFCRWWVERWKRRAPDAFDTATLADAPSRPPGLSEEAYEGSMHYLAPDGRWHAAARAVFEVLALTPGGGLGVWLYRRLPPFAALSEAIYRFVAAHRPFAAKVTRAFFGSDPEPPRYSLVRWAFLRGLGLLTAVAFASFWLQLDGLVGSKGILPAAEYLQAAKSQLGSGAYWRLPSVAWLASSDRALHLWCAAGTVASLAVFFGVAMAPCLWLAWALYVSLGAIGQEFLGFQWDILLCETLLIGALWAPAGWRRAFEAETRPPAVGLWLMRWLLFRLMFESGVVKLASGDATWRNLTALWYHYETQPLPTWLGWWAHQLPHGFQKFSAAAMFAIELGLPLLIFWPRRPRLVAFFGLAALQVLIAFTGNYCFFNLITGLLCLTLLDDSVLRTWLPKRVLARLPEPPERPRLGWKLGALRAAAACVIALAATAPLFNMTLRKIPAPIAMLYGALQPLRSVNGYGLFAVMTTRRIEISVQGSSDGNEWREYAFPYKPGDPIRRPGFVAPHQPRLDWQMWFAALGECRQNPWFIRFMYRLMEGSAPVIGLLEKNPFPEAPPLYMRTLAYEYHFTTRKERRETGAWWSRKLVGFYCPMVSR